jgi:micrococcal nuclease
MTEQSSKRWLWLSVALIAISIIILVIPVDRKREGRDGLGDSIERKGDSRLRVVEIIDGDTFLLSDGDQVRLIGIDTPEEGQPFFARATAFAESILLGKEVEIKYDRELLDRYGRRLVYLFVDSILYNQLVIDSGFASVYLFEKNQMLARQLISAQRKARSSKVGIWSLPEPILEDYYISPAGSFRFHRPLCPNIKSTDLSHARRFQTRDEALDIGLSPCRICQP